jgi:hypothetical protein
MLGAGLYATPFADALRACHTGRADCRGHATWTSNIQIRTSNRGRASGIRNLAPLGLWRTVPPTISRRKVFAGIWRAPFRLWTGSRCQRANR